MMSSPKLTRKLRFGQVGGGRGSFIGETHRRSATWNGLVEFVAGALASTPEGSKRSGQDLLLSPERNYGTWREMLECESALPEEQRIDFVSIATPNHVHYNPALAFVEGGFNVIIEKPMVHNSQQARALIEAVEAHDVVFAVTYNYTGFPMVKEARDWVRSGRLGDIQRVVVEYPQGWLLNPIENEGHKQASWRTDPTRSGIVGAVGDIGTHSESLVSYVTGLELDAICADVNTFVRGRRLDDDASVLLRFKNGARGILWVSQVAAGEENGLNLRVYGTKGGLFWEQQNPNVLLFNPPQQPAQLLKRGNFYLGEAATRAAHLGAGLTEAYFGAFANIYTNYTDAIRARLEGRQPTEIELDFPTVYDGARGVRFMEKVVESAHSNHKWTMF